MGGSEQDLIAKPISSEKALMEIQKAFSQATDETLVEIDGVSVEVAEELIEDIDKSEDRASRITYDGKLKVFRVVIMPTPTHESHIDWLAKYLTAAKEANLFTANEYLHLRLSAANRKVSTTPVHGKSIKEPDGLLIPSPVPVPTIVVESGWSESLELLHRDKDIWLDGFPQVQAVIIINWTPNYRTREVAGVLEVHKKPTRTRSTLVQTEKIFPIPSNSASQVVRFSKQELFAGWPQAVQSPSQMIDFTLDSLRFTADCAMAEHRFTPKLKEN